jgi:hypothetical protein
MQHFKKLSLALSMCTLADSTASAQHFTADTSVGHTLAIRTSDMAEGQTLSAQTRTELLKAVRAGEFAGPLLVDARTFVQRPTPNRNFSRFKAGTLRAGAKTFAGQVVLLNHDQRNQQSRIGTIVKSQAVKESDEVSFMQTLSIVKPHAMESVLDGTIDRFSIGWFPTGTVECSVHKQPMFGAGACPCWPGDSVDGKAVEAVFTSWEGIEVSAVNVPAVVGTGIEGIRAALTALRAENNPSGGKPRNPNKDTQMNIRQILGLPDDATDEQVAAELSKREEERKTSATKLASYEQTQVATEQQLALAKKQRIDSAIESAYADGRLSIVRDATGKRIESELERRVRSVASSDTDTACSLLDALPKSHPNGNPLALQSQKAAPALDVKAPTQTSAALENMMPLMGLDAEDVTKYGPQNRLSSPKGAPVPKHLTKVFSTRHINHTAR